MALLPSRPIFPPGTQGTGLPGPTPGNMPSLGPSWGGMALGGLRGLGDSSMQSQQSPPQYNIGPDPALLNELMQAAMGSSASPISSFQYPGISYPSWDEMRMRGLIPRG